VPCHKQTNDNVQKRYYYMQQLHLQTTHAFRGKLTTQHCIVHQRYHKIKVQWLSAQKVC
jgi:hypothetical protein